MKSPIRWFKSERTFVFDAYGKFIVGLTGRTRPSVMWHLRLWWGRRRLGMTGPARAEAAEAERDEARELLREWLTQDPFGHHWAEYEGRVRAALADKEGT